MSQSLKLNISRRTTSRWGCRAGFVETDMARDALIGEQGSEGGQSPFNRVARPEEVAYAVLFWPPEGGVYDRSNHRHQRRVVFTNVTERSSRPKLLSAFGYAKIAGNVRAGRTISPIAILPGCNTQA